MTPETETTHTLENDGVVQIPVEPGRTPQERQARFANMLTEFVNKNRTPDAPGDPAGAIT